MNIAIITAKSNSRSIFYKNLISICGKPSLEYVIEATKAAKLINKIFILSDSPVIQELGLIHRCQIIIEPPDLCLPDANHGDAIAYAVRKAQEINCPDLDIVTVLLGNTVMVDSELIDRSIQILNQNPEYDSVMSVWKAGDDHPYRAMKLNNGFLTSYSNIECGTARQDYPDIYFYDQGVWTFRHECINRRDGPSPWWWMGKKCSPIVREWVTGRDFHSQLDIEIAEFWVKRNAD